MNKTLRSLQKKRATTRKKPGTLILTICLGKDRNYIDYTRKSMIDYAKRTGSDIKILNDDDAVIKKYSAMFSQLKSGRSYGGTSYFLKVALTGHYLEKYSKVLWLDDTCIVGPKVVNLFDKVRDGEVGACPDKPNCAAPVTDFNFIKDTSGFKIDIYTYINSGVVVYTKGMRHLLSVDNMLENNRLFEGPQPEQGYLNYLFQINKVPIILFDRKYNDMVLNIDYVEHYNSKKAGSISKIVDKKFVKSHKSHIFHITGWWGDTNRLKAIIDISESL